MAGAAFLSGLSAFRCGVGMVRYMGPECNRIILQSLLPEAMYDSIEHVTSRSDISKEELSQRSPVGSGNSIIFTEEASSAMSWADILIAGPGLSRSDAARQEVIALTDPGLMSSFKKLRLMIIDADALNIISEEGIDLTGTAGHSGAPHIIITPHVGEMARLTGLSIPEVKENPEEIALDYSDKHKVTVVLKDHITCCASAGRMIHITSGCSAMAKAGSGDVLTGFIAGCAAVMGSSPEDSAPIGAHLHGIAGTIAAQKKGCHGILARDIAEYAPMAFSTL